MTELNNTMPGQSLDVCTIPLNHSAMIDASAGTGKTYTITYLVLRLLLGSGGAFGFGRPLPLEQLLIVTFTRAAASDLRERIREKIRISRKAFEEVAAGQDPDGLEPQLKVLISELTTGDDPEGRALLCARLLQRAERGIDDAAISTIHSFANSSLNQIYSFEAGRAFEVELADEEGIRDLRERARLEVWRDLFYPNEDLARQLLSVISISSPEELSDFTQVLSKVRLSHSEKGVTSVLGYAVTGQEFESFSKGRSASEVKRQLYERAHQSAEMIASYKQELQNAWEQCHSFFASYSSFDEFKAQRSDPLGKLTLLKGSEPFVSALFVSDEPSLEDLSARLNGSYSSFEDFSQGFFGKRFCQTVSKLAEEERQLIEDFECHVYSIYRPVCLLHDLLATERMLCCTLIAILIEHRLDELCVKYGKLTQDGLLFALDQALHDPKRGETFAKVLRSRYPVAMIDEFQDTDPVQFSIFHTLYLKRSSHNSLCFLIGDPKQSIYAFRNADIHSYSIAKAELEKRSGGSGSYTLDTNYRSSVGIVEGVNCIFSGFPERSINEDPFFDHEIGYTRVKASLSQRNGQEISGKWRLFMDDEQGVSPGTRVYFDHAILSDSQGKPSTKKSYRSKISECAAQVIVHCLKHGMLEDKEGQRRRVRPSDIAVLVRNYNQFRAISSALSRYKLAAVYYSDRSSVVQDPDSNFFSEAALSMLTLMEAISDYSSQGKVLKLMGTPLSCLSGEEFSSVAVKGDHLEKETEILRECMGVWLNFGFLSAFTLWMRRHDTMSRLLSFEGGERKLTDYLQIAELMQEKHGEIYGVQAQLHYYRKFISGQATEISQDAVRRRLESEREQIKIYTIYKSKGLEFPLVFLPFLWGKNSGNPNSSKQNISITLPPVFYSQEKQRRMLALKDPDGSIKNLNDLEKKREDMRLLYVALTRACAANFIFINHEHIAPPQALTWELTKCLGPEKPDFASLKQLFETAQPHFTCIDWIRTPESLIPIETTGGADDSILECSTLPIGAVCSNFTVSSYSAVTSGLHDSASSESSDTLGDVTEDKLQPRHIDSPDCFSFPAGTAPGSFLHEILEKLNFAALADLEHDLGASLFSEIRYKQWHALYESWYRRSQREGYTGVITPPDELTIDTLAPLTSWFKNIVLAKLPRLDNFSLSALKQGDWIPEMDYLLPTAQIQVSAINALCKKSADEVYPAHLELKLHDKQLCGFITGSLDLVFRAPMQGQMRYFVADYKSTLLGRNYEDYASDKITASVFDPKNRYDVQYLFYSLALHRFLKSRIKYYDYERDFGGVFYLYLRGMRADDSGSGIFYTKPSLEILDELDALFSGRS